MANGENNVNPLFLQLVLSLQSAAWYQLGKTVSPISGKIERSLDDARMSIDLLTMLQEKTKGNLLEEEKKIIDNTVYTLQMNYVDEMNDEKKKTDLESSESDSVTSESGEKKEESQSEMSAEEKPSSETPENE